MLFTLIINLVCAEQLLVVINDILDITKMEENKMVLENVAFSLRSVLEESLDVVGFDAEKKRVELVLDILPNTHGNALYSKPVTRYLKIKLRACRGRPEPFPTSYHKFA